MPFTGITLSDLNNAMRDLPMDPGILQPNIRLQFALLEALRGRINEKAFVAGGNAQVYIETSRPITGTIHYEDADIPLPQDVSGVLMLIPLREMMVNAGLTHSALERAIGMPGSWVNAAKRALELRADDWNLLLDRTLLGAGQGALARVVSAANAAGITTITCDNTYYDFGWENVALIEVGDQVEIYAANLATQRAGAAGVTSWEVLTVTFGDRANGAATTGTFTVADDATLQGVLADNDVVFIKGVKSGAIAGSITDPMPLGLLGHVQDGSHFGSPNQLTTYQNLLRATYVSLRALVWDAADFAAGTPGTPDDWDLSVISNAFNNRRKASGKGMPDLLLCDSDLAMAISRRQKAESGINVVVNTGASQAQDVTRAQGPRFVGSFTRPDGEDVPIAVADTIPSNVLFGVCLEDLVWHVFGDFRNWAPTLGLATGPGDIWMKSPGDRKTNFEAPYGGRMQITGRRCDRHFCILDMKDNI